MIVLLRKGLIFFLSIAVAEGMPAPRPDPSWTEFTHHLPSMLTSIRTEDELDHYSQKWRMTPVEMCTLMAHQLTVAQPLQEVNFPMVNHLPSISEMATADAVLICEKVLEDERGRLAITTTVVEETGEEFEMPADGTADEEMSELEGEVLEAVGFSDDEMKEALEENEAALFELLKDRYYNDLFGSDESESSSSSSDEDSSTEFSDEDSSEEDSWEEISSKKSKSDQFLVDPNGPTLAEKLGRRYI